MSCRNPIVGALLLAAACQIPSTLGLPCTQDSHCDEGQFCASDETCQAGTGDTTTTSTSTTQTTTTDPATSSQTVTTDPSTSSTTDPSTTTTTTGPTCGQAVETCDNLDVLIVVDNSESMDDEFDQIIPAFLDVNTLIGGLLEGLCTYRIGVTTTETAPDFQPAECQVRGALSRNGALAACFADAEHPPWVAETDQLQSLGCLLAVGRAYDDDEKQLDTTLAAIGPELNAEGACNEGFLRDDAPLAIILVTDEDDDDDSRNFNEDPNRTGSAGGPAEWFDQLIAIHPVTNVAVVAVIADDPAGCNWAASVPNDGTGAEYGLRILDFLSRIAGAGYADHVQTVDVCADTATLQEQIQQASEVLDALCMDAVLP